MSEFSGKVHTVLGPIAPAAMGQTMMHEHLLLDISPPEVRSHPGEAITLANCGHFRRYSHLNPFNLRLTNEAEAIDEMRDFIGVASLVLMVLATTLVTPPILRSLFAQEKQKTSKRSPVAEQADPNHEEAT